MDPAAFQPPLTRWGHAWRTALSVWIGVILWADIASWQWGHARWWFFTDLGVGCVALGLTFLRRRSPVAIAAVTALCTGVSATAGGPATLTLASLSTRRRWKEILPVAVLSVAVGPIPQLADPVVETTDLRSLVPITFVGIGAIVAFGLYIGSRRELLATLRERAERAEAEQDLRVRQARTGERARIAREMHDVLAHRISLLTLHAGALAYREDLSPQEVSAAAEVIRDTSNQALTELRTVLGVLRQDPGDAEPEPPQPDAADLPGLVDEARAAGAAVEYDDALRPAAIPVAAGRTLYRIAQEALTNARKHAPGTKVTVSVTGSPAEGVTLRVTNPLRVGGDGQRGPASGLGLVGVSERVALAGGRLTHRVTPDELFVLEAWLPWPP